MQIETKFSLGQEVHRIGRAQEESVKTPCKFCRGKRQIKVDSPSGSEYAFVTCPRCKGYGELTLASIPRFAYIGTARIGSVTVSLVDMNAEGFNGSVQQHGKTIDRFGYLREERYMIDKRGFPSGSVYTDVDLFATQEEADSEIEDRNREMARGANWKPERIQYEAARSFLEHADVYEHTEEHAEMAQRIIDAFEFVPDHEQEDS